MGLAVLASMLTIYLSSSTHHTTSKDSTFLIPPLANPVAKKKPASSPPKNSTNERQPLLDSSSSISDDSVAEFVETPRKVMFYAAGSGIPEIKTILSGKCLMLGNEGAGKHGDVDYL